MNFSFETLVRAKLWTITILIVLFAMTLSKHSRAQHGVLWQHDDSVATLAIEAGESDSDSFKLMSAITEIDSEGPALKRIETSDQKLKIYCVGIKNGSVDGNPMEASCNVEVNFFQTLPNVSKTNTQVLLIQNPNDAKMIQSLVSANTGDNVFKYKTKSSNFCIQCNGRSSQPVCAVSIAPEKGSCNFINNLQAVSRENVFVDL